MIIDSPCDGFSVSISPSNTSRDTLCDGVASANVVGGTPAYSFIWSDSTTNTQATNLCTGAYSVTVTDLNGCTTTASTFVGADSIPNPCNGFNTFATAKGETAKGACDGSANATITGGNPSYTYNWSTGSTSPQIKGLCAGTYSVTITDNKGCTSTATAYVFTDTSVANVNPIIAYTKTTDETAADACDGTATVTALGGTAPYSYKHSNGSKSAIEAALCTGLHTVDITDAIGSSVSLSYLISTPENTVSNITYQDSTVNDTVVAEVVENCAIPYGSVDSVLIHDYTFFSSDLVTVTWAVYSPVDTIYITESYDLTGGNGVYSIELSLLCPEKAIGQFLKATDQIYYHAGLVNGVKENNTNLNLSVYPNPFTSNITVKIEQTGTYVVSLYDIRGKLILNESHSSTNQIQLNLKELSKGQYILTIQNDTQITTVKIVK